MRRCVAFDIDDTLALERDYVRSGFRAAERELGLAGFAERCWAAFERGVRGTVFDETLAESGIDAAPDTVARLVDVYRAHRPAIELLTDARCALDALAGRVALACVTDGPAVSQRAKSEALGLDRWIGTTVFTADLGDGLGKPHTRAFEIVQEATGCAPGACTYVADNPAKDFAGPKALGWRTVRVRRAEGLHHGAASGPDVDRELPDLTEIHTVL